MRNAFIDELITAADSGANVVLVVGDLGYRVVEPFARRFPSRFFNAGVAEQNMMGLSAGLASEGFHVFVYSIANFSTFRCAEQIRNDVDYHNLPVTVVAVGGGLAYGNLGYSHHAVQDYALMRSMPNMLIAAPGDPMEVRACVRYLVGRPQPSYLRLGKAGEAIVHETVPAVAPGGWLLVRSGDSTVKATYVTTGAPLAAVVAWAAEGDSGTGRPSVHSMPLWSMQSKDTQVAQVSKWDRVITVEDHLRDAGLGSWMMEAVIGNTGLVSRISMVALDSSVTGLVAKQATLHACGGFGPVP